RRSLIFAADCPRTIEGKAHDVCVVHFPCRAWSEPPEMALIYAVLGGQTLRGGGIGDHADLAAELTAVVDLQAPAPSLAAHLTGASQNEVSLHRQNAIHPT